MARPGDDNRHPDSEPDSTGPNARPRDDTIAETGAGIPDESGGDEALAGERGKPPPDPDRVFKEGKEKKSVFDETKGLP